MRLTDFQKLEPIIFNTNIMDNNAKRAASQVNWKDSPISATQGALESDPFRRYQRDEDEEPGESSSRDEPAESAEEAAMDAVRHLLAVLKDSDISKMANDVLRDHARQRSDGRIVSGHRPKVGHGAGYITDSAMVA